MIRSSLDRQINPRTVPSMCLINSPPFPPSSEENPIVGLCICGSARVTTFFEVCGVCGGQHAWREGGTAVGLIIELMKSDL